LEGEVAADADLDLAAALGEDAAGRGTGGFFREEVDAGRALQLGGDGAGAAVDEGLAGAEQDGDPGAVDALADGVVAGDAPPDEQGSSVAEATAAAGLEVERGGAGLEAFVAEGAVALVGADGEGVAQRGVEAVAWGEEAVVGAAVPVVEGRQREA